MQFAAHRWYRAVKQCKPAGPSGLGRVKSGAGVFTQHTGAVMP
jgi:hypothetical protein